jgi:hypothetical protein
VLRGSNQRTRPEARHSNEPLLLEQSASVRKAVAAMGTWPNTDIATRGFSYGCTMI